MATLIIDKIDPQLKNRFKAKCYEYGLDMRRVIIALMQQELDERFACLLKKK